MDRTNEDRPGAGTPKRSNKQLRKLRNSLYLNDSTRAGSLSRKKRFRKAPPVVDWRAYEAEKKKLGFFKFSGADYDRALDAIKLRGNY